MADDVAPFTRVRALPDCASAMPDMSPSHAASHETSVPASVLADSRTFWLSACLLVAGLSGSVVLVGTPAVPSSFSLPAWALAVVAVVAHGFTAELQMRRETRAVGLAELPLALGLFLTPPIGVLVARVVAVAVHGFGVRRWPARRVALAAGVALAQSVIVIALFRALLVLADDQPYQWLAAIVAMEVGGAFGAVVNDSVRLFESTAMPIRGLWRSLGAGAVVGMVEACLALVAVISLRADSRSAWLLLAIVLLLLAGYRGYASLRERHASLGLLYEFTLDAERSPDFAAGVRRMLHGVRVLLRAEVAEAVIHPGSGQPGFRMRVGPGDAVEVLSCADDDGSSAWGQLDAAGTAVIAPRGTRDAALRQLLRDTGRTDLLAAPLQGTTDVLGTIAVADRAADLRTFQREDLPFFETVARHVAISLENGHLIERLRHQAAHDRLTGLPNRAAFTERLNDAVDIAAAKGSQLAVLLIDIDRFKEVNDTLGHHNGDLLLQEVALRLAEPLSDRATVARLGGDEFAVLLPFVLDGYDAQRLAGQIVDTLAQPFDVDGLTLDISVGVGIALYPEHASDGPTLLQRADVAMSSARGPSCIEVYSSERDQYSPRRLALVAELRRAIEKDELVLYYQPKADMASGQVAGVEALLRWNHPQHGFLPPDEFIPLAEHTGLIRPLTQWVLRAALQQCAAWHSAGLELGMAVNLSAKNLLDHDLPDDVGRLLQQSGVDPSRLTLEITESSVMAEPVRTIGVLQRLAGMGVTLAVDDFGTGYSSLSYLSRLPVREVKIDKSFVLTMTRDRNHAVIVHSIVDLGANLGLRIVAEGVEDAATWDQLASLGCTQAQGYFLSRPVPAASLTTWLAAWIPPDGSAVQRRAGGQRRMRAV